MGDSRSYEEIIEDAKDKQKMLLKNYLKITAPY